MSEITYETKHVIVMPRKEYDEKRKTLTSHNRDKSIRSLFSGLLKAPIKDINIQSEIVVFSLETKDYPILSKPYTQEELKNHANGDLL